MPKKPSKIHQVSLTDFLGLLRGPESKNAPDRLFAAGNISLCREPLRVSIIGTRVPSASGQKRAETLTRFLVAQGATIVAGLALGVDTVAHETAIQSGVSIPALFNLVG